MTDTPKSTDLETPSWPDNPPAEWLTFHLAHPGPGTAWPGDPNPAFFWNGRYHLHYIYDDDGFVFGHLSSEDMVRWTWHPTVLGPKTVGHGMFSGTGFLTKEGQPAMIYHGQGSGKNWIQIATDDNLDSWSDPVATVPTDDAGNPVEMNHWDPDCWVMDDTYYALSGGPGPKLIKSDDLETWEYLGDLLHEDYPDNLGIPRTEDISCANFFQIGDKWMLLCISHPLGCRYYLGDFKDEKYLPESHAMMNWEPGVGSVGQRSGRRRRPVHRGRPTGGHPIDDDHRADRPRRKLRADRGVAQGRHNHAARPTRGSEHHGDRARQ